MFTYSTLEQNNTSTIWQCNLSTAAFDCEASAALHIQQNNVHIYSKEFQCEGCGRGFNQRQNYELHLATHVPQVPTTTSLYLCPVLTCARSYKRVASLRSHLELHAINDNYTCRFCGIAFEYRMLLESHINLKHQASNDKCSDQLLAKQTDLKSKKPRQEMGNYTCAACDKQFRKPCLLQRHSVVHTTEKSFQCSSCPKCYSQKSSLQRHLQHYHKGLKTHACPKCQAR